MGSERGPHIHSQVCADGQSYALRPQGCGVRTRLWPHEVPQSQAGRGGLGPQPAPPAHGRCLQCCPDALGGPKALSRGEEAPRALVRATGGGKDPSEGRQGSLGTCWGPSLYLVL